MKPGKINIVGEGGGLDAVRAVFKPHGDFRNQISWKKQMDALMKLPKPS